MHLTYAKNNAVEYAGVKKCRGSDLNFKFKSLFSSPAHFVTKSMFFLLLKLNVLIISMSANISVNCSNPARKNKKNRVLTCHNPLYTNKSMMNTI